MNRTILILVQVGIWSPFLIGLFDPNLANIDRGDLTSYGAFIDMAYNVGYFLSYPVIAISQMVGLDKMFPHEFFPMMTAENLNLAVAQYGKNIDSREIVDMANTVFTNNLYTGAAILWFPLTSVVYFLVFMIFEPIYEKVRNVLWNMVIEYLFHRKKAKLYERELERRVQQMDKLNDKMYTMAQETNSLRDSVITDEMTKVYNKRFFLNHMMNEFETCRRNNETLNLIMLDIDHFKKLNDGYGHVVGDEVLKEVAKVLRRFTPDQCYACRFGGEEFGIIMPRQSMELANEIARHFQEHIQKLRFPHIDEKLRVTISQGICAVDFVCPDGKKLSSYNDMLELADQQLYRSKKNGRNRVSVIALLNPDKNKQAN